MFANLTGKHLCWCFPVKLAKCLRTPNFEEHLQTTADQMICNEILLEKIRAVFRISIKFDLNVRKTGWKKIRFQVALDKTYSLTPPPLIHQKFKHHQRTKINKMFSTSSVLYAKFTITVLKSTQVFHSNGNWTRTASVGALNWVWTVYATTDCEHKFQKMGLENWLPIEFNLTVITTTLFNHKWEMS